jgi:hypothetical protein
LSRAENWRDKQQTGTLMSFRTIQALGFTLFCLPLVAPNAWATGNLDCSIDDKQLNFEIFALTGGTGGIVQVNQGSIEIKAGDDKALRSRRAIEQKHIEHQWIYGNELRLRIVVPDAKDEPTGSLILIGAYKSADDSYAGRYVLSLDQAGGEKVFKGRMKCG